MKWATPASAGLSRRDPASTYAAIETDREPGRRAEMTRGPSGSSVRWNIAWMVARNTSDRRPAPGGGTARRAGSGRRGGGPGGGGGFADGWGWGSGGRRRAEREQPVAHEVQDEQARDEPHQRMDL